MADHPKHWVPRIDQAVADLDLRPPFFCAGDRSRSWLRLSFENRWPRVAAWLHAMKSQQFKGSQQRAGSDRLSSAK
jgi:hypothetical protein